MHLFEPRWVNMVDVAMASGAGIIGLLYIDGQGGVLPVATMVEIVACNNLEAAGRMVTVRGVGRCQVYGLSPEVGSLEDWGAATVQEIPELLAEDAVAETGAEAAAAELSALLRDLDLRAPEAEDGGKTPMGPEDTAKAPAMADDVGGVEEAEESGGPELWTHERTSLSENFLNFAGGAWLERVASVGDAIDGVPVPLGDGAPDSAKSREALVCLYAALGGASIQTRFELFMSRKGLATRLQVLAKMLQEKQGMARARRALASIFTEE